jgi:phage shock protein PspC (stress-responsive transcriptional regulator)
MDEHRANPTTAPATDNPADGGPARHTPPADGLEPATDETSRSHTPPTDRVEAATAELADSNTTSAATTEPARSHTPPAGGSALAADDASRTDYLPPAGAVPPAVNPLPAGNYGPPTGNYDPSTAGEAPASGTRRTPIRLHRSRDERMIAGVCGGLAETLGIDVVILRLALVLATVLGVGAGVILYVACWILMPSSPLTEPTATSGALVPAQGGLVPVQGGGAEPAPGAS